MSKHVLVIEPRKEIIEDLEDRLESIGHTYDIVTSQRQARDVLDRINNYSYIILSLDVPVKPERPSKMKFGLNLFKEIRQIFSDKPVPVIVTLDRHLNNTDIAIRMLHEGALIAVKPFKDNIRFSLENAVFAALDSQVNSAVIADAATEDISNQVDTDNIQDDYSPWCEKNDSDFAKEKPETEDGDFLKPEMIFYENRVELCGVTVCGDSSMLTRRLLDLLKERTSEGKYKAYSGYELAVITDCESGQPGISACINNFKRKINKLVKQGRIPLIPNLDQIIVNDRSHGYRLEDNIVIIENTSVKNKKRVEFDNLPKEVDTQQKILDYLFANRKASRAELEQKLNLSEYAVNRQLQGLRDNGLIKCVGKGKSTLWLLAGA